MNTQPHGEAAQQSGFAAIAKLFLVAACVAAVYIASAGQAGAPRLSAATLSANETAAPTIANAMTSSADREREDQLRELASWLQERPAPTF